MCIPAVFFGVPAPFFRFFPCFKGQRGILVLCFTVIMGDHSADSNGIAFAVQIAKVYKVFHFFSPKKSIERLPPLLPAATSASYALRLAKNSFNTSVSQLPCFLKKLHFRQYGCFFARCNKRLESFDSCQFCKTFGLQCIRHCVASAVGCKTLSVEPETYCQSFHFLPL